MSHYDSLREVTQSTQQKSPMELQLQQLVYERNQLLRLLLNFMSMDEILKDIKSQR